MTRRLLTVGLALALLTACQPETTTTPQPTQAGCRLAAQCVTLKAAAERPAGNGEWVPLRKTAEVTIDAIDQTGSHGTYYDKRGGQVITGTYPYNEIWSIPDYDHVIDYDPGTLLTISFAVKLLSGEKGERVRCWAERDGHEIRGSADAGTVTSVDGSGYGSAQAHCLLTAS